jgi:hypothetical protein
VGGDDEDYFKDYQDLEEYQIFHYDKQENIFKKR